MPRRLQAVNVVLAVVSLLCVTLIVKQLISEFKKDGYRVVDIDGARVYTKDGWGLVRASANMTLSACLWPPPRGKHLRWPLEP